MLDNNGIIKDATEAAESIKNSRIKLRENLMKAGVAEPPYNNAAHHIVAVTSKYAREARAILQKYNIDINGADNGVFLPTVKGVAKATYHNSLHTERYYRRITELLSVARGRDDVLDILNDISEQLLNNTFV